MAKGQRCLQVFVEIEDDLQLVIIEEVVSDLLAAQKLLFHHIL
jgi:hypothetical protein